MVEESHLLDQLKVWIPHTYGKAIVSEQDVTYDIFPRSLRISTCWVAESSIRFLLTLHSRC